MTAGRRVAVAFSGGRDSTALLHATLRVARRLDVDVVALHVHHGLNPGADGWLLRCRRVAARWRVPFAATRLHGPPPHGRSIEAWARAERYRALATMAREHRASLVLLAHHRRDQAETFLLQALRGGGVAGLAAMPMCVERDGLVWARPWLACRRDAIEAYLRRHRLGFIDDTSNVDPRYARNRLRSAVWPALVGAFDSAEGCLAEAAMSAAQAAAVLDEVAEGDLATAAPGDQALDVETWSGLSVARRRNALLAWLRTRGIASSALIERLCIELPGKRSGRWPAADDAQLRLHRGVLRLHRPASAPAATLVSDTTLRIDRAGRRRIAGFSDGHLVVRRVVSGGVALPLLASLRVAGRQGGEQFQLAPRSTPRSLKKQFQSLAVSAWLRDGPLLYAGDRLVFVAGLGIDARVLAADGEPQLALRWVRDEAARALLDPVANAVGR